MKDGRQRLSLEASGEGRGALAELAEGLREAAALSAQATLPLLARELFALGLRTDMLRDAGVGGGEWDWRAAAGAGRLSDDLCRFVADGDADALRLFDAIAEREAGPVSEAWLAVRAANAANDEAACELAALREALLPFVRGEAEEEDEARLAALLGVSADTVAEVERGRGR